MRARFRLTVPQSLFITCTCAALLVGCVLRPEAIRARGHFGKEIDFGFVAGNLLVAMKEPDNTGHAPRGTGTAFPVGPAALVTAGHAFMTPFGRVGDRLLVYGEGQPPKRGEWAEISDDPGCPWKQGCVVRLARPDRDRGDFALVQMDHALPQWDRAVDPTYRPQPGEVVVVGSRFGRDNDRVLTIAHRPLPDCGCTRALNNQLPGLLAGDYVVAEPDLGDGWSGSPVKALRRIGAGDEAQSEWVTFGYIVAGGMHFYSLTSALPYSIIMPLPEDVGQYVDLPPGGDNAESDKLTRAEEAAPPASPDH